MNADITLLAIVVLLTVFFVIRRTHVALITLALCGGYVLSDKISTVLTEEATSYIGNSSVDIHSIIKILLLFGPPAFIAFHFRKTQRGSGRTIEQIVPAFALSLLIVIFVVEQLTPAVRDSYLDLSVSLNQLWTYSSWVIVFAFATAIFDFLLHKPYERHSKKK